MKPFNQTRRILEKIKDEQFKLDTAISKGNTKDQKVAEKNIRNLRKDLARLSEDS